MIDLLLFTKDHVRIAGLSVESDHVPRVGEIIDVSNLAPPKPASFFVFDVDWIAKNRKLVPRVHCRQWHEGDRRIELEQHGWI